VKIYIVMHQDRHTDVEATVFESKLDAIARAKEIEAEYNVDYNDEDLGVDDNAIKAGWLYSCTFNHESDCVWVIESELN